MKKDRILLAHGGGGVLMHELIRDRIVSKLANPVLDRMEDAAVISGIECDVALTTDSFVVDPIFFPGGDIGKLAVCGTVNDLAVQGAVPVALTLSLIIEEGFSFEDLDRIVDSIAASAKEAGVIVATGDFKVVEKGAASGIFINTAGIGRVREGLALSPSNIKDGDVVIINGPIADHGVAVMVEREGLKFESEILTDCAPLNGLVSGVLEAAPGVRCMKDATRGGLAGVLVEMAEGSGLTIEVDEEAVPVNEPTRAACDLLGLDPLVVANEGKVVVVVEPSGADKVIDAMKKTPYGREAKTIGRVKAGRGAVLLKTLIGGSRVVEMPYGELLPRIC